MVEFLRESQDEFDVVLIDAPPILPVTDAAILGSKVDGVILVYQVGKVARGALKRAKAHLEAVNSDVWGVVLNDFKAEISGFSPDTAYYGKYYGGDADEKRKSQSGFEKLLSGIPSVDSFRDFASDKFEGFRDMLHRRAAEEDEETEDAWGSENNEDAAGSTEKSAEFEDAAMPDDKIGRETADDPDSDVEEGAWSKVHDLFDRKKKKK